MGRMSFVVPSPLVWFEEGRSPPEAVVLLDRQPKEHRAGLYETAYRPMWPGTFELVFFLPNPKVVRCMDVTVDGERDRMAETLRLPRLVWTEPKTPIVAGAPIEFQFRLETSTPGHSATRQSADVLALASGHNWHW